MLREPEKKKQPKLHLYREFTGLSQHVKGYQSLWYHYKSTEQVWLVWKHCQEKASSFAKLHQSKPQILLEQGISERQKQSLAMKSKHCISAQTLNTNCHGGDDLG